MTNTAFNQHGAAETVTSHSGIRTILLWLESPMAAHPADELPLLRAQVKAWNEVGGSPQQRALALDGLYERSCRLVAALLPELTELTLPIPRKSRRLVRSVLDLLQMLADDTLAMVEEGARHDANDRNQAPDLALWRSLHALAQQLMISHLIASPAPTGAWQQLHQTYARARDRRLEAAIPRGQSRKLQHIYHAAILLGCAQPASLTAREVVFLAAYFERFAGQIETISAEAAATAPGSFWVDPTRDAPALPFSRKLAPSTAPLEYFSCARLGLLLKTQIAQLNAGTPAEEIGLPELASTPAGVGVLRRLAGRWSDFGKRRFHRRRQGYRTVLGTGIDGLWKLSKEGDSTAVELSSWMITNESPDGYAIRHVSGKIGTLSVGNVVAVRTGDEKNWQICMVRWAVSENPEDLELGLQILAPKAVAAILARPVEGEGTEHLRVLVLPEIPLLRTSQLLVVASGMLTQNNEKLVLVIEDENLMVREVKSVGIDEQTGSVDILSIEPDQRHV
ncbi:hypothetical protein [Accumulibacter sp.]|uniref:hypothetical protein n=1 Tax=Accumulibacter sp. TaxID=2053492 RepID=UPI0035B2745D